MNAVETLKRPLPEDGVDVADQPGGEFWVMIQDRVDYLSMAIPISHPVHGTMMAIVLPTGAVYITKEQAASFFGLTEVTWN